MFIPRYLLTSRFVLKEEKAKKLVLADGGGARGGLATRAPYHVDTVRPLYSTVKGVQRAVSTSPPLPWVFVSRFQVDLHTAYAQALPQPTRPRALTRANYPDCDSKTKILSPNKHSHTWSVFWFGAREKEKGTSSTQCVDCRTVVV